MRRNATLPTMVPSRNTRDRARPKPAPLWQERLREVLHVPDPISMARGCYPWSGGMSESSDLIGSRGEEMKR